MNSDTTLAATCWPNTAHGLGFMLNGTGRFREPVVVIWVASFGSALHYPVTFYYLLEVGATKVSSRFLRSPLAPKDASLC